MPKKIAESTLLSETRKALKADLVQALDTVVEALTPGQLRGFQTSRHITMKAVSKVTQHGLQIEIYKAPCSHPSSGRIQSPSNSAPEKLVGKPLRPIETAGHQQALDAALVRAGERGNSLISDIMKQPEMLSSEEMAKRLGVTRDTVNRRREEGRLLGLSGAKRGFRYPAWQLDRHGKLLMGLAKVVEAAGDPWSAYRWLTATHPELGDISGLDALRQGKERELVELIEQLGETFS